MYYRTQNQLIYSLKNKFYYFLRKKQKSNFSENEIFDIYSRCILRSLDFQKAREMIVAYEAVFENLFSEFKCHYIFSFPIDRYPMDVMNRVALRW